MDIEGLGEETVELLYENGLVTRRGRPVRPEGRTAAELPRLGEKSADNIIRSIRGSVEVPFRRVLLDSASASWAKRRPNTWLSISARSTP